MSETTDFKEVSELIQRLRSFPKFLSPSGHLVCQRAADALEDLTSRVAALALDGERWIQVSERLPEERDCYIENYGMHGKNYCVMIYRKNVPIYGPTSVRWPSMKAMHCALLEGYASHWMPLPAIPAMRATEQQQQGKP